MTAAIIDIAARKRVKVQAHPTRDDSRRRKGFDKTAAFALTRKEIEKHALYKGAAQTEDLGRWLVAWIWFNPWSRKPAEALVEAARRMGRKNLPIVEAEAIVHEARYTNRRMKADALALWLGCTYADREALRLTRIGACDVGPQVWTELRKRKARLREERRRREEGVKPRAEWLAANSLARTEPWKADGISRPTWYRRRRKARETGPCAAGLSIAAHTPVSRDAKKAAKGCARPPLRDTSRTACIVAAVGRAVG
jgi:hypothetical protein